MIEELALLAHDGDALNRFEAGQQLVLDRMLAAIRAGGDPVLDEGLTTSAIPSTPRATPSAAITTAVLPSTCRRATSAARSCVARNRPISPVACIARW